MATPTDAAPIHVLQFIAKDAPLKVDSPVHQPYQRTQENRSYEVHDPGMLFHMRLKMRSDRLRGLPAGRHGGDSGGAGECYLSTAFYG